MNVLICPFPMQRDHSKSRLDNYHLESNGSIGKDLFRQYLLLSDVFLIPCSLPFVTYLSVLFAGLFGHVTKKPKIMRQPLENLFDNNSLMSGSISSSLASQMSNVSVPNKLIKILAGRGQGRKAKVFKVHVKTI